MEDRAGSDFSKKIGGGGEKRASDQIKQKDQLSRKRASVDSVYPDVRHVEEGASDSSTSQSDTAETPQSLDLNVQITCPTKSPHHDDDAKKFHGNSDRRQPLNAITNCAKAVSSSANHNPFHSSLKGVPFLKPADVSECGSSCGSPPKEKENDSLRVWKEMKQNGFLSSFRGGGGVSVKNNSLISSSHGGIPVPKKRGRKSKDDLLKENIELGKREQVDRFARIAAPSGLLNSLNPGIINHVRNRKQVHTIIESLVQSEKHKHLQTDTNHSNHQVVGASRFHHLNTLSWDKQFRGGTFPTLKPCYSVLEGKCRDVDPAMIDQVSEDTPGLTSPSSAKAFENAKNSSLSKDESANLSVQAATVASQWLELLQQDIKGRLSACRRSRKRVQAIIETELQFLMSKEFSSNQENDPSIMQNSADRISVNATADMHMGKWSAMFGHMDKELSEEEKQLESLSYQVKEMQVHCDNGLNHIPMSMIHGLQQMGESIIKTKLGKGDESDKELAVKAAAASIYSTCNFLSTKENISCF